MKRLYGFICCLGMMLVVCGAGSAEKLPLLFTAASLAVGVGLLFLGERLAGMKRRRVPARRVCTSGTAHVETVRGAGAECSVSSRRAYESSGAAPVPRRCGRTDGKPELC